MASPSAHALVASDGKAFLLKKIEARLSSSTRASTDLRSSGSRRWRISRPASAVGCEQPSIAFHQLGLERCKLPSHNFTAISAIGMVADQAAASLAVLFFRACGSRRRARRTERCCMMVLTRNASASTGTLPHRTRSTVMLETNNECSAPSGARQD